MLNRSLLLLHEWKVAASLLLLVQLLTATPAAADSVTLQLKWKHQFQFAGFYMAKEKGFYREAGLDVHIKEAMQGTSVAEEMASGRAEYGVADPGILLASESGTKIRILSAVFQHSPLILLVREEPSTRTLADLKGKRIMFAPGLNTDIEAALAKVGITSNDFIRQEISYDIRDLVNGNTDAFSAYITDQPHQLEVMGVPYRIFHPQDQGIDFYGDILIASQHEAEEHPHRVRAIRDASIRGWEYALEHIDETITLIRTKYDTQKLSRKQLLFEAQKTREMIMGDVVQIGYMSERRWKHIADTYVEMGLLKPGFNVSELLYSPEAELTDLIRKYQWPIAISLLLFAILLLGLHSLRLAAVVRQLGVEH